MAPTQTADFRCAWKFWEVALFAILLLTPLGFDTLTGGGGRHFKTRRQRR